MNSSPISSPNSSEKTSEKLTGGLVRETGELVRKTGGYNNESTVMKYKSNCKKTMDIL